MSDEAMLNEVMQDRMNYRYVDYPTITEMFFNVPIWHNDDNGYSSSGDGDSSDGCRKEGSLETFGYDVVEPWAGMDDDQLEQLNAVSLEISEMVTPRLDAKNKVYSRFTAWKMTLRTETRKRGNLRSTKGIVKLMRWAGLDGLDLLAGLVYTVFVPLRDLLGAEDPAGAIAARNYVRHVYTQVQKNGSENYGKIDSSRYGYVTAFRRIKGVTKACGYMSLALVSGVAGVVLMKVPWARSAGQSLCGISMCAMVKSDQALEASRPDREIELPEGWADVVPAKERAKAEMAFLGRLVTVDESELSA